MYDIFLFYYTYWLLAIIIYFFMPKSTLRHFYLTWILLMIATSSFYIIITPWKFSAAFLLLLLGTFGLFGITSLKLYEYIVAFVCMIGCSALLLWEIIAPVWFFIPTTMILALFIVIILCFCIQESHQRIIAALIGVSFGLFVSEMILMVYGLNDTIGALQEMTILSVTLILLLIVDTIQRILQIIVIRIKSFT